MLTFVGLGLYHERSITVEGRDALTDSDRVFAEFYTSRLAGTTIDRLEAYHDVTIEICDRETVEQEPGPILSAARTDRAVFLTAGDPMISTTHVDLRLRAADRGIDSHVVHGTTAATAASSLTGLQNYRFGKATTLPFPYSDRTIPQSVSETIEDNRERGLHTLCFLDIKAASEKYMTADTGAALLAEGYRDTLACAVCRAGSPEPRVLAARLSELAAREFGDPLHLLVVPGDLHHMEADALVTLADAPADQVKKRRI